MRDLLPTDVRMFEGIRDNAHAVSVHAGERSIRECMFDNS